MNDIVIVVTGAAPLSPRAHESIPRGSIVIAADGALDDALAAGLQPAALVGDLDSVSDAGREWAETHATVQRHEPDKERTDTELALAMAADLNPSHLILISGGGDRLDHTLAAIGALGHSSLTSIPRIDGCWADQRFTVVHGPGRVRLELPVGTTLSLLAMHGPCSGVSITGVRWPLESVGLAPLVGHGVSNEAVDETVDISLTSGVLTVFINPLEPTDHEQTEES